MLSSVCWTQTILIEEILAEDSVSSTVVDILSVAILAESQEITLTSLAITHLTQTLDLFMQMENETVESIDEQDAVVRVVYKNCAPIACACSNHCTMVISTLVLQSSSRYSHSI